MQLTLNTVRSIFTELGFDYAKRWDVSIANEMIAELPNFVDSETELDDDDLQGTLVEAWHAAHDGEAIEVVNDAVQNELVFNAGDNACGNFARDLESRFTQNEITKIMKTARTAVIVDDQTGQVEGTQVSAYVPVENEGQAEPSVGLPSTRPDAAQAATPACMNVFPQDHDPLEDLRASSDNVLGLPSTYPNGKPQPSGNDEIIGLPSTH